MTWQNILIIAGTALITGFVQHCVRSWFPPQKTEITPQPISVSKAPVFVTGESCAHNRQDFLERLAVLESRTGHLEEKFPVAAREITAAGEERVRRLHQRIDAVCASIEGDLKSIPHQIISILKNTGAI